jgi:hypothetical protein
MTGNSGRLVILPKKSYCPWKPENVERVLRDERLERERLERLAEREKRHEHSRLSPLRASANDATNDAPAVQQHINLFQAEEEEFLKKVAGVNGKNDEPKKQAGIMPVLLGESELKARGENRPFYLCESEQSKGSSLKEERRKDSLDPMRNFARKSQSKDVSEGEEREDEGRNDRKSRKEKERKHGRLKGDDDRKEGRKRSRHNSDLEELRRRRREREVIESKREADLLYETRRFDDRQRSYQDQYNPGLSRSK